MHELYLKTTKTATLSLYNVQVQAYLVISQVKTAGYPREFEFTAVQDRHVQGGLICSYKARQLQETQKEKEQFITEERRLGNSH